MPDDLNETVIEFPDNRLLIDLCGQFEGRIGLGRIDADALAIRRIEARDHVIEVAARRE